MADDRHVESRYIAIVQLKYNPILVAEWDYND